MKQYKNLKRSVAMLMVAIAGWTWAVPVRVHAAEGPHKLSVSCSPKGAGTVIGDGDYTPGTPVYLSTTSNFGYRFKGWIAEGDTISKAKSFNYTMPDRNMEITAAYVYDPASPGDPQQPPVTHPVYLSVLPAGAGALQVSHSPVAEGEEFWVYAKPNSGYKVTDWSINGSIVENQHGLTTLNSVMSQNGADVICSFEYNPTSPLDPGANYFDSQKGLLIIDSFTPGGLLYAIQSTLGNSNLSDIRTITVKGCMMDSDYGVFRYLDHVDSIDLSRTWGCTTVPAYSFRGLAVTEIILPSNITELGNYCFYDCKNLTCLTFYSLEPPLCSVNTFSNFDNQEELLIFVPRSAMELYINNQDWKEFTVMPIVNDAYVLQVNLPDGASDGSLRNYILELVNSTSGVRQRYVVTDRLLYTFNSVLKGDIYNVYLLSPAGLELGRIEEIVIPDHDIEITLENVKSLLSVSANILDADGHDITSRVSVEWFQPSADGNLIYLRKSAILPDVPEGQTLICRVSLDNTLGTVYLTPDDVEFTVSKDNTTYSVSLTPFRSVELTGLITDEKGFALSGATVSANQILNRKYSRTNTVKTDRNGLWKISVMDAPQTYLTYAAQDCINEVDTIGTLETGLATIDLGTMVMKEITGPKINYRFTYLAAGAEKKTEYYSDYNNVALSVYNRTQGRTHTELSQQYPILALLDHNVNVGDEIVVTATSKSNSFLPVEKSLLLDENLFADVVFDLVEKGGLSATVEMTENPEIVALLYNENGELVKKEKYSQANVHFSTLDDGLYTLVSMGQSDLMNSIIRISNFEEMGLVEDRDYVKNEVQIESGKNCEITISNIPSLEENIFAYTTANTGFTSNKSSLTTGNYLTLRSIIDFKDEYESDIKNVKLIIELPSNCELVEQSVIQGQNLLPYTLDDKRVEIPLGDKYQNQTRFCVMPTSGGEFNASAAVMFEYKGQTLTQPIGCATSQVKDIEISAPSVISSSEFIATGMATPKSNIEIYGNNTIIGHSVADAQGKWKSKCTIPELSNLKSTSVFAKIITPSYHKFFTEDKEVYYDAEAVLPESVTMTFWNDYYKKQYEIIWNLLEGTCNTSNYDFYTTTDISFLVRFTSSDVDKVRNIVLNVFTSSGEVKKLVPVYSDENGCWVAVQSFSSFSLPTNVSVDYELNEIGRFDADFLANNLNLSTEINEEFEDNKEWLDSTIESLINSSDESEEDSIVDAIIQRYGIITSEDNSNRTEESIINKLSEDTDIIDYLNGLLSASPLNENVKEYIDGLEISNCSNLSDSLLIERGFSKFEKNNGQYTYYLSDGSSWQFVDLDSDMFLIIDCSVNSPIAEILRANEATTAEGWIAKLEEVRNRVVELVEGVYGFIDACNERLGKVRESTKQELEDLYKDRRWLKKNSNNAWLKGELKLKIAAKTKTLEGLESTSKWLNNNFKPFMSSGFKIAGKMFAFSALIQDGIDAVNEVKKLIAFRESLIPPCPAAENETKKLKDSANRWAIGAGSYYFTKLCCDIVELGGVTAGIAALVPSGGTSVSAVLAAITVMVANIAADYAYSKAIEGFKERTMKAYKKTERLCKPDPDPDPDPSPNNNSDTNPNHYPNPNPPVTNPINPIHDPSGFVYEAIPTNRVEGVQATIYYKETKEDIYGDLHEEITLWNAEEYAQENPLFTDENGMYRWDVPQGLWQVKFEKDGYVTAYSEWLPVPPPQLDVNIGIVQNKQPEVMEAHAYEEGVEVQFDKYMRPATLNPTTVFVTVNGERIDGEVVMIDAALADEFADENDEEAQRYASRVRFVPALPLTSNTGEVKLTVSRDVMSYTGIPMTNTYSQTLDVEKEIQAITAADIKILYGNEKQLTVFALPSDAAAGKKLNVRNSSDLIMSVEPAGVILDNEGKAVITIKGNIPGRANLSFTMDGVHTSGNCTVDVVSEILTIEPPTASRASGTAVYRGTMIELFTDSKNADIYYTTDGSCPCNTNGSRHKYSEPIIIDKDTRILAVTISGKENENMSETVEFNYTVKRSNLDFRMNEGWTWISHNFDQSVAPSALSADENIIRIQSQTQEVIRDPHLGFIGNLTELNSGESYKVESSATSTSSVRISDYTWNPSTPITLDSGWNWLGYPMEQTMTPDEAFAGNDLESLDVIVGQSGFAQYDGEKWIGTLETLVPGTGYMYQSSSAKNIRFNSALASNSAPKYVKGLQQNIPLVVDIHKYGNVMPVIATIQDSNSGALNNEEYLLAAFCGTECRGIGREINGLIMMNVYGNPDESITFRITDSEGLAEYPNNVVLDFNENIVGDLYNPYVFTLPGETGVASLGYDGNVKVRVDGDMLRIIGIDPEYISLVQIYDAEGYKQIQCTDISTSGIRISNLTHGVYVVIVNGNDEYSYFKITLP